MRFLAPWAVLLAGVLSPRAVRAEADVEEGKRLFEEAKAAMANRKFDEACPKFEQSFAVSKVAGSLLNWADCEEQRGRLATALDLWKQGEKLVASDAERTRFVRSRIAALAVRVPRVTFAIPEGLTDVVVVVDGRQVATKDVLLLDPGLHGVEALAKGQAPEKQQVDLLAGESKTVSLFPNAKPIESTSPPPPVAAPPAEDAEPLIVSGWVVGSIGLAGFAAFGITAGLVYDACNGTLDPCGGTEGSDADQVRSLNIANATMLGLGIAGAGVGAVLLGLGYSKDQKKGDAGRITVDVGAGSLGMRWAFQ
jgi:hypothetical protein